MIGVGASGSLFPKRAHCPRDRTTTRTVFLVFRDSDGDGLKDTQPECSARSHRPRGGCHEVLKHQSAPRGRIRDPQFPVRDQRSRTNGIPDQRPAASVASIRRNGGGWLECEAQACFGLVFGLLRHHHAVPKILCVVSGQRQVESGTHVVAVTQ